MNWSFNEFVEVRVLSDKPDAYHVCFVGRRRLSVVVLAGTMTFSFIRSCITVSAPASYLSGTLLAPVTFFGMAFGLRPIFIGSHFIGSGLSLSLKMASKSAVNLSTSSLIVVLKQNSSLSSKIVFGKP